MGYDPNHPYGAGQPPPPYGQPQPPYGQPPTQYNPPPLPPDYGQQPYGQAPPMYGGAPPMPSYGQPQKKSSLRWLWITLAIVGGLLVLGCGGCAIASFAGIGYFAKTIAGPSVAVTAYYQNIKDQNYDQAYTYLDTSGTVQSQIVNASTFTQLAQSQDQVKGKVTAFSQTNISTDSTNGVNTANVTMSVTRNGSGAYTVQLQLKEENGAWKITSFDNI